MNDTVEYTWWLIAIGLALVLIGMMLLAATRDEDAEQSGAAARTAAAMVPAFMAAAMGGQHEVVPEYAGRHRGEL